MIWWRDIVWPTAMIIFIGQVTSHESQRSSYCQFYNDSLDDEDSEPDGDGDGHLGRERHLGTPAQPSDKARHVENCGLAQPDKLSHCYALWEYDSHTKKRTVKLKGCFLNNIHCTGATQCTRNRVIGTKELYFCCCTGNMCNRDLNFVPAIDKMQTTFGTPKFVEKPSGPMSPRTLHQLIALGAAVLGSIIFLTFTVLSWYRRYNRKLKTNHETSRMEQGYSEFENPPHLYFIEPKARGRFGEVWRAKDRSGVDFAVKISPLKARESWENEARIFKIPGIRHENILDLHGAYKHPSKDFLSEYWLVTPYQSRGSLSQYLEQNLLTWQETLRIVLSITRGLAHLHQEFVALDGSVVKPAIAHRDIKSKNVLLRPDMSACIGDFGLALVVAPGSSCAAGKIHARVGTIRYMAPEILQGAINFNRDAFLNIDMYSFGLVLWEIASCCIAHEAPITRYKLPYEDQVGLNPSILEMYECVYEKRRRPKICSSWRAHKGLSVLCDTMEECWDHDADARVTASCALNRVTKLIPT